MSKINNIEISKIDDKGERLWFSVIKQISQETGFGTVELSLTVKNGKITNISQIRTKCNFNINS